MAGSVTGISRGRVLRIGMTLSTPLSNVYLNDIIEASIFSQKGDSGAPVFNDALKIIGIILGGTSTTTYILPINKLLSSFQCNLLT
jgi:predicted transcriptional regulator